MLTFLVLILVVFFVGGSLLSGLLGMTALSGMGLFKVGKKIREKLRRRRMIKLEREVTVFCPCSHSFLATPRFSNNWLVVCPRCCRSLRVDLSKKKKRVKG